MSNNHRTIHVWAFAFAFGVTWGLGILLLGWFAAWWHWGIPIVDVLGSGYIGYTPTFIGGIIGGIWAFVDGFIFGLVLAAFYKWFCMCCRD